MTTTTDQPITYRDTTAVSFTRPNGHKTTIYMDVAGEPFPLGKFTTADVPERIRQSLASFEDSATAVGFEVAAVRLPSRGPNASTATLNAAELVTADQ